LVSWELPEFKLAVVSDDWIIVTRRRCQHVYIVCPKEVAMTTGPSRAARDENANDKLQLTNAANSVLEDHLESIRIRILREALRERAQRDHREQVRAKEITSAI
jgi:hypothetical protein